MDLEKINICQNCGNKCTSVLDLGYQPICNRYMKSKSEFKKETKYPLGMVFCPKCSLVQLPLSLPTDIIFSKDFNYLSGSSKDVVSYFDKIAKMLVRRYKLTREDFVLDIGSNDGAFLKPLKDRGIGIIGVDPAPKPAAIANADGICTIVGQFEDVAGQIKKETNGKIRIITAFNVMAHTSTIYEFLKRVRELLEANPKAVFISQSQYLPTLMSRVEYDTCYHEHARYYTVTSVKKLFSRFNLNIYDCEKNDIYGGSILIYSSLKRLPRTKRCSGIIASENKYKRLNTYKQFGKKVEHRREELLRLLTKLKKEGKHIIGIGAPMKSSTLLNYCDIGTQYLDGLTEVNKLKIGMYSPGVHLRVIDEGKWLREGSKTDYALILSWNMANTIMKKLRENGYKGKFIIPLPKLRIV